ncbi:hypothetical protein BDZ91DRAFT_849586 [Kalaharituber pfeilii]|nr:hypothetical protein BDZ91DRAFT_849586 [Kalaharituber pfeilii]
MNDPFFSERHLGRLLVQCRSMQCSSCYTLPMPYALASPDIRKNCGQTSAPFHRHAAPRSHQPQTHSYTLSRLQHSSCALTSADPFKMPLHLSPSRLPPAHLKRINHASATFGATDFRIAPDIASRRLIEEQETDPHVREDSGLVRAVLRDDDGGKAAKEEGGVGGDIGDEAVEGGRG